MIQHRKETADGAGTAWESQSEPFAPTGSEPERNGFWRLAPPVHLPDKQKALGIRSFSTRL
jgi:hypothetical protein